MLFIWLLRRDGCGRFRRPRRAPDWSTGSNGLRGSSGTASSQSQSSLRRKGDCCFEPLCPIFKLRFNRDHGPRAVPLPGRISPTYHPEPGWVESAGLPDGGCAPKSPAIHPGRVERALACKSRGKDWAACIVTGQCTVLPCHSWPGRAAAAAGALQHFKLRWQRAHGSMAEPSARARARARAPGGRSVSLGA
jgi:hypothetical protein